MAPRRRRGTRVRVGFPALPYPRSRWRKHINRMPEAQSAKSQGVWGTASPGMHFLESCVTSFSGLFSAASAPQGESNSSKQRNHPPWLGPCEAEGEVAGLHEDLGAD